MPPSEIGLYYTRRLKKTSNHGALDLKVCLLSSSSSFVYFLIRLIRWAIVCQLIREKNKRDRIDVVKECVRGVLRLNFFVQVREPVVLCIVRERKRITGFIFRAAQEAGKVGR